jgi:Tol biopolymer transport system component
MNRNTMNLKSGLICFLLIGFLYGCHKKSPNIDNSGDFNLENLSGKLAFSRSDQKIIILDGDKKNVKTITLTGESMFSDRLVSLSSDGQNLVYTSSTPEGYQVFKISAKGENNLKLTKSLSGFVEHYTCPVWSADGNNIFYVENGFIILGPVFSVKPDGTDSKQITDFDVYRKVSVSKDNSYIVYSGSTVSANPLSGLYMYNINDKSVNKIKTYDNTYKAYSPALSPDEKKIAFVLRHGANEQGTSPYFIRIMIINIDGSNETLVKELVDYNVTETFVTWSPDGTKLAYDYGSTVNGDQGSHIFTINTDGTALTQITSNTDYDGAPSWVK